MVGLDEENKGEEHKSVQGGRKLRSTRVMGERLMRTRVRGRLESG